MIVEKEKKPEERICFVCNRSEAVFTPDGKHNFISHIIDGEPKTVCMYCKMELLKSKRPRNGF